MRLILILTALSAMVYAASAQRRIDTTKKTVVITSSYKPVLKPVTKINFNAAAPVVDSTRPVLTYNVPAQNLFFSYLPAALRPLALAVDSTVNWRNSNYVKVGYGNFSTPYLQAGLSFGDGTGSVVNLHTKHISSKGNLPFQQYSRSYADVTGVFNKPGSSTEWRGGLGFDNNTQYWYGYLPSTLSFSKDQLKQTFSTFRANVGLRNKEQSSFGLYYSPSLTLNLFGDNRSGKETNVIVDAPLTKTVAEDFAVNVGLTADLTNYKRLVGTAQNNNIYYITPSLVVKKPEITVNAGLTPSWDNKNFKMLPNFTAVFKGAQLPFAFQAGFIGYYNKNTFQSLANFNNFIFQPDSLVNTRITELYGGIKGSGGEHFTYSARLSMLKYTNAALFLNDTIDGKTFKTVYEPSMRGLRLHGEMGYTVQDKFSFIASANTTAYGSYKKYDKAYGLLPVELTASLRWQVVKDLQWKTDFFYWQGAAFRDKSNNNHRLDAAMDLSTGVEFTVLPRLSLWVQFNNVFNSKYSRWNQYEVLGFNVLGGIVYSFSQTGK